MFATGKSHLLELVSRLHSIMAIRRDTGCVGRYRNRPKAARQPADLAAPLQVLRGGNSVKNFLQNHHLPEARVQIDTDVRDDDPDLDAASAAYRVRWHPLAAETTLDRIEPQQPTVGGRILMRVFETSRLRNRNKRYGIASGWSLLIESIEPPYDSRTAYGQKT
uniref:Uncharacterized protein n=1 Tax=Anopheles funestus TaxID=62324 RepID=A0A4Y0BDM9_ANOFN